MTNLERQVIIDRAREGLRTLERLTTDDFSNGGDRPAREALASILWIVNGAAHGSDELRDYEEAIRRAAAEIHGFAYSPTA